MSRRQQAPLPSCTLSFFSVFVQAEREGASVHQCLLWQESEQASELILAVSGTMPQACGGKLLCSPYSCAGSLIAQVATVGIRVALCIHLLGRQKPKLLLLVAGWKSWPQWPRRMPRRWSWRRPFSWFPAQFSLKAISLGWVRSVSW